MSRLPALVLAAALLGAAVPLGSDEPQHPVDLIEAVLAGLLGMTEVSAEVLQEEVAEAGGLPFRGEVPLDYISPGALPAYLSEVIDDQYPPDRARADERLLVAFDLLPEGTDLRTVRGRLLADNVAGFYDERPGRRKLYAVSRERRLTPANQLILAHELRHAQQDQYAALHGRLPDDVGDFDDRRLAFVSALEGDATLVMERFLVKRLGTDPTAAEPGGRALGGAAAGLPALALPDIAPVLRDQLVVPYLAGRDFAEAVLRARGWEAIRGTWSVPPASMEQVLHPEKFLSGEAPREVVVSYSPAGGRLIDEGVFGEAFTRTLLGDGAEEAAAGWAGDTFKVWEVGGRTLLVWTSDWDDARETSEFKAALTARLARTHRLARAEAGALVFERDGWRAGLRAAGTTVTLVRSDSPAAFAAALAARP